MHLRSPLARDRVVGVACMLFASTACGDAADDRAILGDAAHDAEASSAPDTPAPDTPTPDTSPSGFDATPEPPTDVDEAPTLSCTEDPGAFGCPCADNVDCNSGFCLPSRQGGEICTKYCTSDCPAGFDCSLIQFPGSDPTFLCLEIGLKPLPPLHERRPVPDGTARLGRRSLRRRSGPRRLVLRDRLRR